MPTILELQTNLQNVTNQKITQTDIANALGTSRANISLRIKNNSQATLTEVRKIVEYLHVSKPHEILNNILKMDGKLSDTPDNIEIPLEYDIISMDYYPSVFGSCGSGSFVFSEEKEVLQVPCRLVQNYSRFKNYSIINATGDSMTPYILDHDRLIVEHYDGGQICDNRIYIFRFYDNIFIKRLVLNLDQIVVISDNKNYQQRIIERAEADNFQIIGRIVGILRSEY